MSNNALCTTAGISYCWPRVCVGQRTWLPSAKQTKKRSEDATAHTGERLAAMAKKIDTTKNNFMIHDRLLQNSWSVNNIIIN